MDKFDINEYVKDSNKSLFVTPGRFNSYDGLEKVYDEDA